VYRRSLRSLREELGRDSNPGLPDDQEGHIATPHPFLFLKTNCAAFLKESGRMLVEAWQPYTQEFILENKMK